MFAVLFTVLMLVLVPLASLRWGVDSRWQDQRQRPTWPGLPDRHS